MRSDGLQGNERRDGVRTLDAGDGRYPASRRRGAGRSGFGTGGAFTGRHVGGAMRSLRIGLLIAFIAVTASMGWTMGSATVQAASLKPPAADFGGSSGSGSNFVSSRASGLWEALFQLARGETYTYKLTHDIIRSPRWSTDWELHGLRPAPHTKPMTTGELNFSLVGREDEIRFWFDVDGVRGNGTAPNDVRALAGSVLVAALTGPEPLSAEGLRLLATPFQWVQWYDSFAMSTFRNGVVWRVSEQPPHRFDATPYNGRTRFWGELTRGRDLILEMGVDLREPLPWDVIARDGWNVYRAELEPVSGTGRRR